jgi:hypothetical protein
MQDVIRFDPERKRKDGGQYKRVSEEELILKIEARTKDVSADDGN